MKNLKNSFKKSSSIILISFLALCAGCSKTQNTNQNSNVYKIAVAAPQFGPYQALGLSIVNGAKLAVDVKNKNGGIDGQRIKLISVDDGGLAGEGTWRARNLVSEMVLGVIGHLNSDISIPASEVYSKAKIPQISPGSTNPFFTERPPVNGYVFRTIGRDDQQGLVSANFVIAQGYKKVGVLYNNRGYGLSLASEFVKQIESSQKATVVFYETYKVASLNSSQEVNKMKLKNPEIVFFVGEYGDAAKLLKEIKNQGLKTAFIGSEGSFDSELIGSAKAASEGAHVIALKEVSDDNFLKLYKKKFGKDLGVYSANSYDAANILISAIEKVKEKNPEKIAKAIKETMDYQGLSGNISFDEKGDLVKPTFSIYVVEKGMFIPVN